MRQVSVSPKNHYTQKMLEFKYGLLIKEIIVKAEHSIKSNFPQELKIDSKLKTGEDEIANELDKYFADIGPSLAKDVPDLLMLFERFLRRVSTTLPSQTSSINELKDAFFSLKTNKSPGSDKINFSVIKHCSGEL